MVYKVNIKKNLSNNLARNTKKMSSHIILAIVYMKLFLKLKMKRSNIHSEVNNYKVKYALSIIAFIISTQGLKSCFERIQTTILSRRKFILPSVTGWSLEDRSESGECRGSGSFRLSKCKKGS